MSKTRGKHGWLTWLVGFTLLVGMISAVNLLGDVGRPFAGYITFYNPITWHWQFDNSTPTWWSSIAEAGLPHETFELLQINGQDYNFQVDQAAIFAEAYTQSPPFVTLAFRQGEAISEKQVRILPFTFAHFVDFRLADLISGFGFWLLALIVLRIPSSQPLNRVFIVTCSAASINRWALYPSLFLHTDFVSRTIDLCNLCFLSLIGVLLVHFALLFPNRSRFYHRFALYTLYFISALSLVAYSSSRLLLWSGGQTDLVTTLDRIGHDIAYRMTIIGVLALLARLTGVLLFQSSKRSRRQAAVMLVSIVAMLPFMGIVWLSGLTSIGRRYTLFWQGVDLRFLTLMVPTGAALVILRYQTFRRTPPILLLIPILALGGAVASLGTAVWRQSLSQVAGSGRIPPLLIAFVMTLLVSLVWVTQSSWRGYFGRVLHWRRRGDDAAKRFGQRVIGQTDLAKLPGVMAAVLVAELELERTAVWLWHNETESWQLAGQAGQWARPLPQQLAPPDLLRTKAIIRVHKGETAVPLWLQPLTTADAIELVAPLWVGEARVGLLALGKRWDEEIMDERDLETIELITQQAALFLLTAVQVQQLQQSQRLVATAQERERFKIAQELHDTVQQFLGHLPFYLDLSRQAILTNPERAGQLLEQCVVNTEKAAHTVREIRANLAPSQLENGLRQPVLSLIEQFEYRIGVKVALALPPEVDTCLPLEPRHMLYRVLQQALENIALHAHATHVQVTLGCADGRVTFAVQDDGRGCSEQQRRQAQAEGSFGLRSMSARIESVNGQFTFQSAPQQGTLVQGWLPVGC